MKIYVGGDSFAYGWPTSTIDGNQDRSWPSQLAKKLDVTVVNDARAGCSNYRIYRRLVSEITSGDSDLVVMALTHWFRAEISVNDSKLKPGRIHQLLLGNYIKDRDEKRFYRNMFDPYLYYSNLLRMIISVQSLARTFDKTLIMVETFNNNFLCDKNIEWLTDNLDRFNFLDLYEDSRVGKKFQTICDLTDVIDMSTFMSMDSMQNLVSGVLEDTTIDYKNHPGPNQHEYFATLMAEYITKNYLEKYNGKTI